MNFDWGFFWSSLLHPSATFCSGFVMTIVISVCSMFLALMLGLVVALIGRSRFLILRAIAGLYVWVIRGTPLLVQLVILYMGFAVAGIFTFHDAILFGLNVKAAVQAAIIGLTVHEGAYIAEIIRSGLDSIPEGQLEAAKTLGMSNASAMRWVILPQALRVMVPPLGNIFNGLMKETSILSIIGVSEMFLVAQSISSATFKTFEIFIVAAIYYLGLTTVWTVLQGVIERRLDRLMGLEVKPSIMQQVRNLLHFHAVAAA